MHKRKNELLHSEMGDNIFVSVGGGVHAINNDGFNQIGSHFSVSIEAKLITPTWGVRAQFNGVTQHFIVWITVILGTIIRRTLVVTLMQ